MSNFCSRIVNEIVMKQKKNNLYEYKVNMKMAIYICKKFYRTKDADAKELMKNIAKYTEPIRQGRSDERNIKIFCRVCIQSISLKLHKKELGAKK